MAKKFAKSGSFKVIDVNKTKKHVTSACYDRQHASTYHCNGFHTRRTNRDKIKFFQGRTALTPSFEGNPLPNSTTFCRKKLESWGSPQ